MYCKNCGNQMEDFAAICVKCGASKGAGFNYCNRCGQKTHPQAKYCSECGNLLNNSPLNDFIDNGQKRLNEVADGIMNIDGYATLSLILGILSIVCSFGTFIAAIGCSVAAIILGKKAIAGKTTKVSSAKAGVTLAIFALVIRAITLVILILMFLGFEFGVYN